MGDLIKFECDAETISALAERLEQFGAIEGDPEWLVSAVWLCAGDTDYVATSSTKVLSDGYIARPLAIAPADDFVQQLRSELPDIAVRLMARGSGIELPEPERPRRPAGLRACPSRSYSTSVLIRVARRAVTTHRVACGLLLQFKGSRLLVGTDPSTPAMVLSEEEMLIDRYVAGCERLSTPDYLSRCG